MKIGIIGAGFTGLAAGYYLVQSGHDVTIFEKDSQPGGLAIGYQEREWDWTLEKHYHHWFTNDKSVLNLAKEIGYEVLIKRPKTSVYIEGKNYQLDSPLALLRFPRLSIIDRVRMGIVLGLLRYDSYWQPFEKIHATVFLEKAMGERAYKIIWKPQLTNKFGSYIDEISLAWFWARIKKRTSHLAYPKGGFLAFASALIKKIQEQKGKVFLNTELIGLKEGAQVKVRVQRVNRITEFMFDRLIITLPMPFFVKIAPQLPKIYTEKYMKLKGLGAINIVLRLKTKFFSDNTYWLSVCDTNAPVMAIVEHTNFMDKKYYNNEHLVYLGNYLGKDHEYFTMNKEEVLKIYDPFLQKIHPNYQKSLIGYEMFKAPFAQPIIPVNYSNIIPPFETPLKNVYLANIQQVYPWDRGTNYAVELGEKVAKLIENNKFTIFNF